METLQGKNVPIKIWTPVNEVESQALDQLKRIASLPWVFHHVAAMPDVHFGKGATVGSVIAMKNAVSPAAAGVDLGCGVSALRTNLDPDKVRKKLQRVFDAIESTIPVGHNMHTEAAWTRVSWPLQNEVVQHMKKTSTLSDVFSKYEKQAAGQMGTLGGGNHFIELCLDTEDQVWMTLHSGSRRIGKELAEFHIVKAAKLEHNQALEDRSLAVFLAGTPEMERYRHDLMWCQEYARLNREVMLELYLNALREFWPGVQIEEKISCHHNYVAEEVHFGEHLFVTRKGAVSAQMGEKAVIPGSMGAKTYVVRGLGNPESFHSASHGAGRKLGRNQAKRKYTRKDLAEQTKGVVCRISDDVVDEIPGAYKKIEDVMANQTDLVEIIAELKQVLCVKG